MLKRFLAVLTTAVLALGLAVGVAMPAAAHDANYAATCGSLDLDLVSYGGGDNYVWVTIDGVAKETKTKFTHSFTKSYAWSTTVSHGYKIEIDAHDAGYDKLGANAITGTFGPCSTVSACLNPMSPALAGFTIATEGDFTASRQGAHVEGTLAVGGDLIVDTLYHTQANSDGSALPVVDGRSTGLLVGGTATLNVSGEAFRVMAGSTRVGHVPAGATTDASQRFYPTSSTGRWVMMSDSATLGEVTATGVFGSTFAGAFTALKANADTIAGYTATDVRLVTTSANGDGRKVALVSGVTNVLRVSGSQLGSITKLWFDGGVLPSATTPFIIDVTDSGSFNVTAPVLMNVDPRYVLWNFAKATSLGVYNAGFIMGSVLAPRAALSLNSGGIEGQVAAASMVVKSEAEIHHFAYSPCAAPPTDVSGAATSTAQTCDTAVYAVTDGSITATAKTGVIYELWNAARSAKIADLTGGTPYGAPAGTYVVKVLPASSSFTVATANRWIEIVVGAYPGDCTAPEDVSGAATASSEYCDGADYRVEQGSVTATVKAGVKYELWNTAQDAKIADLTAGTPRKVGNGTYVVKVLPVSSAYTVSTADTWIQVVVGENSTVCSVIGDPVMFEQCVVDPIDPLTSNWTAHLTIVPVAHVEYRVYLSDGVTWVDQGIWPAGRYDAGTARLPYDATVRVVAEAESGWNLLAPTSWTYDFQKAFACDLTTGGIVEPQVVFAQTCAAGASYALSIDGGAAGTVLWSVNGGPATTQLGTFAVAAPSTVSIVATPAPGSGFPGTDPVLEFTRTFSDPETCDLETLALTGQSTPGLVVLALILFQAGLVLVAIRLVRARRTPRHLA